MTKVKKFASREHFEEAKLAAIGAYILDGKSIRQIAARAGRSYSTIRRWLIEAGVEMRGRGGANSK